MAMTGIIMAVGVFLPMGPLYFALLPLILLAYMGLTQAVKGFYARRYGWQ